MERFPCGRLCPAGSPNLHHPVATRKRGHSFVPCLLEFPAPVEHSEIPWLALLVGIWTPQFLVLYLLLTGKLKIRGSFL